MLLNVPGKGIACGRNRPLCAIHGANRAFAGIRAVELLGIRGTLRSTKILRSRNSEYIPGNLPEAVLATFTGGLSCDSIPMEKLPAICQGRYWQPLQGGD